MKSIIGREGGQNSFKIFEMPELNVVNIEYSGTVYLIAANVFGLNES